MSGLQTSTNGHIFGDFEDFLRFIRIVFMEHGLSYRLLEQYTMQIVGIFLYFHVSYLLSFICVSYTSLYACVTLLEKKTHCDVAQVWEVWKEQTHFVHSVLCHTKAPGEN